MTYRGYPYGVVTFKNAEGLFKLNLPNAFEMARESSLMELFRLMLSDIGRRNDEAIEQVSTALAFWQNDCEARLIGIEARKTSRARKLDIHAAEVAVRKAKRIRAKFENLKAKLNY